MKFSELYSLSEDINMVKLGIDPTPKGAKTYTNNELRGNKYLRFDLGYSESIAKIVYDFIHKTNEDNGYYDARFRVIAYFYDHPLLSRKIGYCIITPTENEALEITNVFLTDLWEHALKTNKDKWKKHFTNPLYFYINGWDHGYFRVNAKDKIYIWEYDPMDKYTTDKETKEDWRDILTNL